MKRDHLDDAIDSVAARLTKVTDDDALATRILASLPDRSLWFLHSWIPRLAITAILAAPAVLSLKAVAPSELPGQGLLTVEPLAIADLPLTAETISPR